MRILPAIALLASTFCHVAYAADPPSCEPNFYTVDIAVTAATPTAMADYQTMINPALGGKCYTEQSSALQGHSFCMYPLVGGAPPAAPELLSVFAAVSLLTPREGGKDGLVRITAIKSQITCKPRGNEGCVVKACSLGTMSVPNCKACGP